MTDVQERAERIYEELKLQRLTESKPYVLAAIQRELDGEKDEALEVAATIVETGSPAFICERDGRTYPVQERIRRLKSPSPAPRTATEAG